VRCDRRRSLSLEAVARSAVILTGGAAVAQVLGIVRELFLAAQVGVSSRLDALLIALVLPTTLAGVLTSGTITALVPAYLEARSASGVDDARRLAGTVMVAIGVAGLVVWALLAVFAGIAVAITGPGLSAAGHESAVAYLRLLAPLAFLAAVSAILYAVCQAEERFAAIAAATVAGPATTLAAILLLWQALDLAAVAVGSLLGSVVSLAILLVSTVRGSVTPIAIPRSDARLRAFLRHAAPLTLSAAILQVNVVGDRAIASVLGPGAVSTLRYAEVLARVPIGAIGPAWGSAIYPALVRSTLAGAGTTLASATERGLRYAIAVFVPVATLTAAVAPVAVSVAYGRGAFAASDVSLTAQAVACFAPLLVILMTSPVLTGAHNARRRGHVLLIGGTLNVILNIVLDVVLGIWLGVIGVALSSSITSALVVAFFARRLATSEEGFELGRIFRTLAAASLASAPVAVTAAALSWTGHIPHDTLPSLAFLVAFGVLGVVAYMGAARVIGMEEPRILAQTTLARLAGPLHRSR
jgi:putative peptidoglycan lipid II flippase